MTKKARPWPEVVPTEELLAQLDSARAKKVYWRDLVSGIRKLEAEPTLRERFAKGGRFRSELAKRTGYSANLLQRMSAADRFLSEIDPLSAMLSPKRQLSMSKVELAKRTFDVDKDVGLQMLRDIVENDPPAGELRARYNVVLINPPYADSRKMATRSIAERQERLFSVVEQNLERFVGTGGADLYHRRYKFAYAEPDAVAVGVDDFSVKFIDSFEFPTVAPDTPKSLFTRFIAELALSSTFFRSSWIAFENLDGEAARATTAALDNLGLMSVGLFRISKGNQVEIFHRPTLPPSPDRQDEAKREILRKGIPGS